MKTRLRHFWFHYLFSTDHKMIGKQYLLLGLAMALVGGFTSFLIRWQLAWPDRPTPWGAEVTPDIYNAMVTMHGTIMVFFVGMPILVGALGNFCIPLMIGARDMAFPRINMLSFWVTFLAALVIMAAFFVPGGPAACGWTAYPPLSASSQYSGVEWGMTLWILSLALVFAASTMGGINYLATTVMMRAKGMTWFRMPILVWCLIGATLAFFFSVGPLIAGAVMLLLDNVAGAGFFIPSRGGDPLLWQHLFWFFGHPEVYVILLPAMGVVIEILPVFSRKPVFGYRTIVWSMLVAVALSYVVWAHHMFISGMNPRLAMPFSMATILISIPFSLMVICMFLTVWRGSIELTTPMLWALGFLATFLIGGLTGIFLGAAASDIYFHDTHFVVAHFHYTFFPSVFFGGFAAISYWFPKMFGRMFGEKLGKAHFWLTFIFFNGVFWPIFLIGAAGMPRRIADPSQYAMLDQVKGLNVHVTYAAIALLASQGLFVVNFFWSMMRGKVAENNPFHANTLEWRTASPPPHGNWPGSLPVVTEGPYVYSRPDLGAADFLPQDGHVELGAAPL